MRRLLILGAALGVVLAFAGKGYAEDPPQAPAPARQATVGPNFVDNDGDGICDRYASRTGSQARRGRGNGRGGYGPGDGTGNQGVGPQDGTGYGPGSGTNCDGTGPKGRGRRAGRQ
jgi:hypothetical protein